MLADYVGFRIFEEKLFELMLKEIGEVIKNLKTKTTTQDGE